MRFLNGSAEYKPQVDSIIVNAHTYAIDNDPYVVDNDSFPIVMFLASIDNAFFKKISSNPGDYDLSIYTHVSDLIARNKTEALA